VEVLKHGKWWKTTGWLLILAVAVRPVVGGHHAIGEGHGDLPAAPASTPPHSSHAPGHLPSETPPQDHAPDGSQPCPCASSCNADGASAVADAGPAGQVGPRNRMVVAERLPAHPRVALTAFLLPFPNAPPLPA